MTPTPHAIRRPRRRRGVTLIEAVLYIAIALALIVGGLVFYQQASTASRMNSLVTLLTSVMAETRALGIENTNAAEGTNWHRVLIARGSIPDAWLDKTKPALEQIRHPFGGHVVFEYWFVPDAGGTFGVVVTLAAIPLQICTRLAAVSDTGRTVYSGGFSSAEVGDSAPWTGLVGAVSRDAAGVACRNGDTNGDGRTSIVQYFLFSSN